MTATIAQASQVTNVTTLTEDQLVAMVSEYAHDDHIVAALIAELDRREQEPTASTGQLVDLLDGERRTGESRDQCVDRLYGEITYLRYLQAEDDTRGHMLNKVGLAADVDPYSLFHGPAARAAKYASRELLDWWKANGRVTWIQFKAERLGRPSDIRAAAAAKRRASDYGL